MALFRSVRILLVAALAVVGAVAFAPAAAAYPCCGIATAQISSTVISAGGLVSIMVQRTTPGVLTMQIASSPVTIGTGTVKADGVGVVTGRVPAGYSGRHVITASGAGGEQFPFDVTIVGPPTTPTSTAGPAGSGGLASTGTQAALATGIGLVALLGGGLLVLLSRPARRRAVPRRAGR